MKPLNAVAFLLFVCSASSAFAFQKDEMLVRERQAELDQQCEAAREVKIHPLREQIFNECLRSPRSTDTEEDCRRKASNFNANRYGGSPRFYDLPQCVEAFNFKKNHK